MIYDDICYQKSCLSKVIIRLDFLEFIDGDKLFGSEIEKEVLKSFPKKGMQQMMHFQRMNAITDQNGTKLNKTTREGFLQEFSNNDGNKISLANTYLALEINKYTKYEDVLSMFIPVFKTMINSIQLTAIRTGIRYINFFGEGGIRPQKNYFVPSVGVLLDTKQVDVPCIRSMAMNEYIIEDMQLNFRFGMYNSRYPQIIQKPDFVLDYDCYSEGAITGFDAIMTHIHKGHDVIQKMFEESITPQLRKVMGNG